MPDAAISALTLVQRRAPVGPDQVALLESTADAGRGRRRRHRAASTPRAAPVAPTVVGIVTRGISGSDGSTLAVFDLPTAQELLLGTADGSPASRCAPTPGVVAGRARRARSRRSLPADAKTQTGAQRSADIAERLATTFQFINTFLLAFAFIALFVAIFLIFNTFSMLVAQRTRELALLRAVGASRGAGAPLGARRGVRARAARRGPRRASAASLVSPGAPAAAQGVRRRPAVRPAGASSRARSSCRSWSASW